MDHFPQKLLAATVVPEMTGDSLPHFEVVISLMPWELRHFTRQVSVFQQALGANLPCSVSFDVSMITAPEVIDWKKSSVSQNAVEQEFLKLTQTSSLPGKFNVENDGKILGCVDKRREHARQCNITDLVCWLDADIHFPQWIFAALINMAKQITAPLFVLTPQVPKLWDETWDPLVHEKFGGEQYGFCFTFNPANEPMLLGSQEAEVRLRQVAPLKFAGGWFTVYSAALLKCIGIPQSFSAYGLEDTFLMRIANSLNRFGFGVEQHLLDGLLVVEDYFDETTKKSRLAYCLRQTPQDLAQVTKNRIDREYYKCLLRLFPAVVISSLSRRCRSLGPKKKS